MPLLSTFHNVDKNIVQALSQLNKPVLTVESLLEKDYLQLSRELMIPVHQLDEFRISLLREVSPPSLNSGLNTEIHPSSNHGENSISHSCFTSAFQLKSVYNEVNMNIGCCSHSLNALLGGGIQMNEITELVGMSGVGKTQFCFTVAVDAALAGHSTIFIDTTNGFSGSRVSEILKHRMMVTTSNDNNATVHQAALARIKVVSLFNIYETMAFLDEFIGSLSQLPSSSADNPSVGPSLLILDSITNLIAPILGNEGKNFSSIGQSLLAHLMKSLDRIASFHCIGVLVTNDARREVLPSNQQGARVIGGVAVCSPFESSYIKPALGHSWQFLVKTRLSLRQGSRDDMGEHNEHSSNRFCTITILKHARVPSAPNMSTIFSTNAQFSTTVSVGLRGVE